MNLISRRKKKEIDGFSSKIDGCEITEFPTILIGQFAKNENYKDKITGYELMKHCLNTILNGQIYLGGRIITVECKNISKLIKFYKQFGFSLLDKHYEKDELLQMIKILQEDEILEIEKYNQQEVALAEE